MDEKGIYNELNDKLIICWYKVAFIVRHYGDSIVSDKQLFKTANLRKKKKENRLFMIKYGRVAFWNLLTIRCCLYRDAGWAIPFRSCSQNPK